MSDLSLPADYEPALTAAAKQEIDIVKLAREIAMDLRPLKDILEHHRVDVETFEKLKRHPYFARVLNAEVEAWQSAVNTGERVRLKSQAMMEEFLPDLYKRMIAPKEDLMKVVKGAELVAKLADLGESNKGQNPGDKVVIHIDMGAAGTMRVAKQVTPQVIDHEPTPEQLHDELQQNLFELSVDNVSSDPV
jgi:hypothetical protein